MVSTVRYSDPSESVVRSSSGSSRVSVLVLQIICPLGPTKLRFSTSLARGDAISAYHHVFLLIIAGSCVPLLCAQFDFKFTS